MLIHFLQAVIGAIIWTLANVVYIDLKRKGVRGFTRFAAFWVGNPTTWITFFAVSEGTRQTCGDVETQALPRGRPSTPRLTTTRLCSRKSVKTGRAERSAPERVCTRIRKTDREVAFS